MPIYEYACPHCQKTFEEWLKSDDDAATHPCPICGVPAPRVISHTSFILKGGGWYVTEYGSHHAETESAEPSGAETKTSENTNDSAGKEAKSDASASSDPGKKAAPRAAAPPSPASSAAPSSGTGATASAGAEA